ncbi:hypothetical protein ACFIQG_11820, partial [Comamonas odontotermitis]
MKKHDRANLCDDRFSHSRCQVDASSKPTGADPFQITQESRFMKVLVPVKRVVDYNVKVRVKSDGTGVDIA